MNLLEIEGKLTHNSVAENVNGDLNEGQRKNASLTESAVHSKAT